MSNFTECQALLLEAEASLQSPTMKQICAYPCGFMMIWVAQFFSQNSKIVTYRGFACTPRSRSPSTSMASAGTYYVWMLRYTNTDNITTDFTVLIRTRNRLYCFQAHFRFIFKASASKFMKFLAKFPKQHKHNKSCKHCFIKKSNKESIHE